VAAQRTGEAMLLGGPHGHHHVVAAGEGLFHVLPDGQLEEHGRSLPARAPSAHPARAAMNNSAAEYAAAGGQAWAVDAGSWRMVSTSPNPSLTAGLAPPSVGRSSSFAPPFCATSRAVLRL